jgi:hypothetical protein
MAGEDIILTYDNVIIVIPDIDGFILGIDTVLHGSSFPELQIIELQVSQQRFLLHFPKGPVDDDHRGFKTHGYALVITVSGEQSPGI